MSHKSKKVYRRFGGHIPPLDPVSDVEEKEGVTLSGKMHNLAQPPTKLPKKIRGSAKESYRPLHRK